jgi:hypothetical protein
VPTWTGRPRIVAQCRDELPECRALTYLTMEIGSLEDCREPVLSDACCAIVTRLLREAGPLNSTYARRTVVTESVCSVRGTVSDLFSILIMAPHRSANPLEYPAYESGFIGGTAR